MSNEEAPEEEQESGLIFIQGVSKSVIERLIYEVSDYKAEKMIEVEESKGKLKKHTKYKIGTDGEVTIHNIDWKKAKPLDKAEKSGGIPIFDIGPGTGEEVLILLAIILLIVLTYAIALLAVWVVGTIFTLGKYRQRVMKCVVEIKFNDEKKSKTFVNRLIEQLLKRGARVETYNIAVEDTMFSAKMNVLDRSYSMFNKGETVLKIAIIYFAIFEIPRYIIEHYYSYKIADEIQWFLWRYPSLVVGIIGLILMIIGEIKIRRAVY